MLLPCLTCHYSLVVALIAMVTANEQCIDDDSANSIGACAFYAREIDHNDEGDELSAIQTHKTEVTRSNLGSRSLNHHVGKAHSKPFDAAVSSAFLFKLWDVVCDRLHFEGWTPWMPRPPISVHLARSFLTIPDITNLIEPGPPVPPVFVLASKTVAVVVGALLVFTILSALFGYRGIFPKPTPMPKDELVAFGEFLQHDNRLYFFIISGICGQMFSETQYLASFANMSVDLHTSANMLSHSLQINMLMCGLSALFHGFFADHAGRKNLMVAGCFLQVLGSITCGLSTDMNWFLVGRVFQGAAAGGSNVLWACMARDCIDDMSKRLQFGLSFMAPTIIVPIFAPCLGGFVGHALGWRTPFLLIACWEFVNGIAFTMLVKETMTEKVDQSFWSDVMQVVSNKYLVTLLVLESFVGMIGASVDANWAVILTYTYGLGTVNTALMLGGLTFGFIVGLMIVKASLGSVPILDQLQLTVKLVVIPALASFFIAAFAADKMWVVYAGLVSIMPFGMILGMCADGLFSQPIKEISGAAMGMRMCFGSAITSVGAFVSREVVASAGLEPRGLCNWYGASILVTITLYWIGFGRKPPEWAYEVDEKKGTEPSSVGTPTTSESPPHSPRKSPRACESALQAQSMFQRPLSEA